MTQAFNANFDLVSAAVAAALSQEFSQVSEAQATRIGKIAARIAADAALINKVAAQKDEQDANLQDLVQPGRKVAFTFGRADTAVELQGTVVARREQIPGQKGSYAQVKIQVGEGFDAEFKTVHPNSVTRFLDEVTVCLDIEAGAPAADLAVAGY